MQRIAVVILGQSHTGAVVNASAARPVEAPPGSAAREYHVFDANRVEPNFQFAVPDARSGFVLNPVIRDRVEAATAGRTIREREQDRWAATANPTFPCSSTLTD